VLSRECRLLVEGEERLLRQWDFFQSPAGTEHIFVGAGEGPCVILMTGVRPEDMRVLYPVSELAALWRERGGGDVRPGPGVHRVRAVTAGTARVLGQPSLGLAPSTRSTDERARDVHRARRRQAPRAEGGAMGSKAAKIRIRESHDQARLLGRSEEVVRSKHRAPWWYRMLEQAGLVGHGVRSGLNMHRARHTFCDRTASRRRRRGCLASARTQRPLHDPSGSTAIRISATSSAQCRPSPKSVRRKKRAGGTIRSPGSTESCDLQA
jgi:hypothetical protein